MSLKELRDIVNDVMIPGRPIVLDLAQLTFIEGIVIDWLVEVCDATGHPVIIRNASPSVRRVLDIVSTVDADGDAGVFAADAN